MAHIHGKVYRVKLLRIGQLTVYSDWFNTMEELREAMTRISRPKETKYVAQERDVLCEHCSHKEAGIKDVSTL
jgi:hypothetical protein